MTAEVILLIIGLVGLWLSAGGTVSALIKIARSLNISELFIGLTVLSIGTSLPEIFTHIVGSIDILNGIPASGVVIGTNIGSNIIQITFILGIVALLTKIHVNKKAIRVDYLVMLAAIAILWLLSLSGTISRAEGAILLLLYAGYLFYLTEGEHVLEEDGKENHLLKNSIYATLGLTALIISAKLVIDNAIAVSNILGVSGTFIGSVFIGVSTAMPELTVALRSILKGSSDISLGTLIGSNITNPMMALGIGAVISGYTVDKVLIFFDLPFWFFVSLIALFFCHSRKGILKKWEAIVLIGLFITYIFLKFRFFMY